MKSGFATLVGRPNVGKSTLLNRILGTKVSIVSDKPQTTRTQIRGILNLRSATQADLRSATQADLRSATQADLRSATQADLRSATQADLRSATQADVADAQIVFVDTPGIHKPRTLLGERLNDTAVGALGDVDVGVLVLDATAPFGRGDRFVAERVPRSGVCVVNKVDAASRTEVLAQLSAAGELGFDEYFPVSAKTGEGVDTLVESIVRRLPEGPQYYPDETVTDVPEAFWVAELVREQLLAVTREEVPHSIACRVTEWEWPRIRCEILVERDSQKGIVIGKGGSVLKEVGTRVREQLPPGAYVELFVKVDKDWQSRAKALERLGY